MILGYSRNGRITFKDKQYQMINTSLLCIMTLIEILPAHMEKRHDMGRDISISDKVQK